MNYISTIIILTLAYLVYCGVCISNNHPYVDDSSLERDRLEHLCKYYKLQETRIENEK